MTRERDKLRARDRRRGRDRSGYYAKLPEEERERRRADQRATYRNYVAQGICWRCKENDVRAPGLALCEECRLASKVEQATR